jgi:hypothetical protein
LRGSWCREGESNPQGTKYRRILSPLRLPVPPSRLFVQVLYSKPVSLLTHIRAQGKNVKLSNKPCKFSMISTVSGPVPVKCFYRDSQARRPLPSHKRTLVVPDSTTHPRCYLLVSCQADACPSERTEPGTARSGLPKDVFLIDRTAEDAQVFRRGPSFSRDTKAQLSESNVAG